MSAFLRGSGGCEDEHGDGYGELDGQSSTSPIRAPSDAAAKLTVSTSGRTSFSCLLIDSTTTVCFCRSLGSKSVSTAQVAGSLSRIDDGTYLHSSDRMIELFSEVQLKGGLRNDTNVYMRMVIDHLVVLLGCWTGGTAIRVAAPPVHPYPKVQPTYRYVDKGLWTSQTDKTDEVDGEDRSIFDMLDVWSFWAPSALAMKTASFSVHFGALASGVRSMSAASPSTRVLPAAAGNGFVAVAAEGASSVAWAVTVAPTARTDTSRSSRALRPLGHLISMPRRIQRR